MLSITTAAVVFSAGLTLALAGPTTPGNDIGPPTFQDAFKAEGFILLPYANLTEPFVANYDAKQKKSRIDYYDKTMRTFQIATQYENTPASGAAFKIVWSPNQMTHEPELTCYQANSTDSAPVAVQTVIPDLKDFKYVGEFGCSYDTSATPEVQKQIPKGKCDVWALDVDNLNRTNNYRFYAQKNKNTSDYLPVRYTMLGRNSLFGSHFDQYELIYTTFVEGEQDDVVFDVVREAKQKCVPYPEGSGLPTRHLFNPMGEFVHHDESHLDAHFEHFKTKHDKTYSDDMEESARKNNFRHNQRFINSQNRKNIDYTLSINHLADRNSDERKYLRGRKYTAGSNGGMAFPASQYSALPELDEVDWRREKGIVSRVKDQAICGSCWSFGTTGHLESMYARKYNKAVEFSEQQLIDCSWNYGNGGCDGGQDYQAYRYIIDHGLSVASDYDNVSAYLGIDGKCHDKSTPKTLDTLLGFANITGVADLKTAIAYVGPISVGIDASHDSFAFYSGGIYNDKDCKNTVKDLDHAVLAVGYGSANGTDYWIIKNSWSTHWGDKGYIKMASAGNLCGVATAPTYAVLK